MKEILAKLTWVECITVIAVLRGCYIGYRSGFLPELLRIAAYLVTVLVTFRFHGALAQVLTLKTFLNSMAAEAAAFTSLLVLTFLVTTLTTRVLLKLLKIGEGGFVYRILGLGIGVCRWLVLLSLIFMILDYSPLAPLKVDVHERSLVGPKVAAVAPALFDFLSMLSPQLGVEEEAKPA